MKIGALLGGLAFLACAHTPSQRASNEAPEPYRLGIDDVVEVAVFKQPDLTRTVPVRPDGNITLPLVGEFPVAGMTPAEARTAIAERMHKWIADPTDISLIVHEVHSTSIYVTGEVMKPGVFPLHSATTVLQALALAGGCGEFSARDVATVVRARTGEKVTVSINDPSDAGSLMLRPGDTVVVR
jgi:polysaccharide export outer membrane protein